MLVKSWKAVLSCGMFDPCVDLYDNDSICMLPFLVDSCRSNSIMYVSAGHKVWLYSAQSRTINCTTALSVDNRRMYLYSTVQYYQITYIWVHLWILDKFSIQRRRWVTIIFKFSHPIFVSCDCIFTFFPQEYKWHLMSINHFKFCQILCRNIPVYFWVPWLDICVVLALCSLESL